LWDCHIVPIEANIINLVYYLFPYWLFTDPGDDDHFAYFEDE